jgi:hypothetical protein
MMMNRDEETCSLLVIEFCRTHFRKLGVEQFAKLGARPDDIAIGAIYSAVDLAQHLEQTGDTASAIAWARKALDELERQSLEQRPTVQ